MFNQPTVPPVTAPQPAEDAPRLQEKVLINAWAPACKCVVTATCASDREVHILLVKQCRKDHEAVIERLSQMARDRALALVERIHG